MRENNLFYHLALPVVQQGHDGSLLRPSCRESLDNIVRWNVARCQLPLLSHLQEELKVKNRYHVGYRICPYTSSKKPWHTIEVLSCQKSSLSVQLFGWPLFLKTCNSQANCLLPRLLCPCCSAPSLRRHLLLQVKMSKFYSELIIGSIFKAFSSAAVEPSSDGLVVANMFAFRWLVVDTKFHPDHHLHHLKIEKVFVATLWDFHQVLLSES